MKILKVISCLLDYPDESLLAARQEMEAEIAASALSQADKDALNAFIRRRFAMPLLDWQAEYDGLFERGRSVSLLLFEHVHGESRDRGQAMVDLLNQYKAAGLDLGVHELPDYIPLYLEFAATQADNACDWLQDVAHILAVLCARLQQRDSDYAVLFEALLNLARADIDLAAVRSQIADEKRDDTPAALDKVWEEEAVMFGGDGVNGGCPDTLRKPSENQRRDTEVPIHFIDAAAPAETAAR